MLKSWFSALCCLVLTTLSAPITADKWDTLADSIMANFTVDDIIGQMTQISITAILNEDLTLNETALNEYAKLRVGSYLTSPFTNGPINGKHGFTADEWRTIMTRIQEVTMEVNGGHPIVYGIDAAHGSGFVANSTLFPHQINGGASFNTTLVYQMGYVTGRDTAAAGIPWVFGPMLDLAQNPLWARTYESFGEDPYLVSVMADAVVRGLQSNNNTAACMKHFVAYSKTPSGHDKDGVTISDFDLLNYFLPPFIAAANAGAMSAMENYISINGVPTVANTKIMRDLIRTDMGFDGVIVTDWSEINHLNTFHRVSSTEEEAVALSLTRTSIDMSMVATNDRFVNHVNALLDNQPDVLSRLTESARRVVKMKLKLGLYENPVPGIENVDKIGSAEDIASALAMARESIVLLKNQDNLLPLSPSASVFLTGHSADDVGFLCGGWSISWRGDSGDNALFPHGITVKQGMEQIAGNSVTYFNGLNVTGNYTEEDLATAVSMALAAEYTVAIIGEDTYAEKSGDINDLSLPAGQIEYVEELASTGTKVILVLIGGRPRLLNGLADSVHAVINGLLPCELGGQAVAEIIYGEVNPSGRLPLTYPKDPANINIPYNHRVSTQCTSGDYCENEWDFGTGLSYTNFTYSDLTLSKTTVTGSMDSLDVSVTVTNSGNMAGKETVMLFVIQPWRVISVPEVKQLKKFRKIELQPGESSRVEFTLTESDWSVYDPQIGSGFKLYAEDGQFVVAIKPETDCDVYNNIIDPMCATFILNSN